MLAGSRRGGNYAHLRKDAKKKQDQSLADRQADTTLVEQVIDVTDTFERRGSRSWSGEPSENSVSGSIQNPLEALQVLVQAATERSPAENAGVTITKSPCSIRALPRGGSCAVDNVGIESYEPVANGHLSVELLEHLLQ